METNFIITVAALCLVQICLSIYCYKVWQLKERWHKLYHDQLSYSTELEEALDRAIGYAKELEKEYDKLFDGMPGYKPYSKDEDAVWNANKHIIDDPEGTPW